MDEKSSEIAIDPVTLRKLLWEKGTLYAARDGCTPQGNASTSPPLFISTLFCRGSVSKKMPGK